VAPVADFTLTPASGTIPLNVIFTDLSSHDPSATITWAWDFENDGTIDNTTQSPVNTYSAEGVNTVNLTVTDSYGATATKLGTVTVNAAPIADFTFTPASGAAPLTVIFTDNSTPVGQVSWAWDFGDGNSTDATVQSPVHTYTSGGTYAVSLTVTDGSSATDTKTVTDAVVTQDSFEITLVNVPVSLPLISGGTTTITDIEFYVNSTTGWEVTAYDADATGYMTDVNTVTHLIEPFKVRQKSDNLYVNLPTTSISAVQIQSGMAEVSGMPYTLGIQQEVRSTDQSLSGGNVYHIVVTLTVGSL
jgi:PKD repeat protein